MDRSDTQYLHPGQLAAGISFMLIWATFLGLLSYFAVSNAPSISPSTRFFLAGSLSGAAGGWAFALSHFQAYLRTRWNRAVNEKGAVWCRESNLLLKPLLWPIGGAIAGLATVLLLFDHSTSIYKVCSTAVIAGAGWFSIIARWQKQ